MSQTIEKGAHPFSPPTGLPGGPAPLYYQLRQAIRARIAAGEWRAGDRIPTIRELGEQYGVSRITVVQALGELAQEGLLRRRQGKGVFVAAPRVEHGPVRLLSFTDETLRRGHRPASRTLSLQRQPADADVAGKLGVEPGAPLVVLQRLRLADDEPMGVQTSYLPEAYVPGLAATTEPIGSLYEYLRERYGLVPTTATDTYRAAGADRDVARLLGVPVGCAVFEVERLARDQTGRLVELVRSTLRGDRYEVVLQLQHLGA